MPARRRLPSRWEWSIPEMEEIARVLQLQVPASDNSTRADRFQFRHVTSSAWDCRTRGFRRESRFRWLPVVGSNVQHRDHLQLLLLAKSDLQELGYHRQDPLSRRVRP